MSTELRYIVELLVESLMSENPDVQRVVAAMRSHGLESEYIEAEVARAYLGCFWEISKELPDRWLDVLQDLQDGRTTVELFPDSLYEGTDGSGH